MFVVFTILAVIGIYGEEQSGGSESGSSVEDDGVTITNCFFRDSESSSSDDDDTNRQCMTAYILRDSGNITLRDNRLGNKIHLYKPQHVISSNMAF